jgi:hypothetical protein
MLLSLLLLLLLLDTGFPPEVGPRTSKYINDNNNNEQNTRVCKFSSGIRLSYTTTRNSLLQGQQICWCTHQQWVYTSKSSALDGPVSGCVYNMIPDKWLVGDGLILDTHTHDMPQIRSKVTCMASWDHKSRRFKTMFVEFQKLCLSMVKRDVCQLLKAMYVDVLKLCLSMSNNLVCQLSKACLSMCSNSV